MRRTVSGTGSRSPPLEKEIGLDEEGVGVIDKLEEPVRVKRILRRGQDGPHWNKSDVPGTGSSVGSVPKKS